MVYTKIWYYLVAPDGQELYHYTKLYDLVTEFEPVKVNFTRSKCIRGRISPQKLKTWGKHTSKYDLVPVVFLSDEGPTLETLDFTIRIGSTPTFSYFD